MEHKLVGEIKELIRKAEAYDRVVAGAKKGGQARWRTKPVSQKEEASAQS